MEAVAQIYVTLSGDTWARNTNWGVGHPCENQWAGVACCPISQPFCLQERRRRLSAAQGGGRRPSQSLCFKAGGECLIADIDLSNNNMTGTLDGGHAFMGGALKWLQELDMSDNGLSGVPLDSLSAVPRLKKLLIANNRFEYQRMPPQLMQACDTPLGIGLACTGLPPESCSAFEGPYRVSLERRATCMRCESPFVMMLSALQLCATFACSEPRRHAPCPCLDRHS